MHYAIIFSLFPSAKEININFVLYFTYNTICLYIRLIFTMKKQATLINN